MNAARGRGEGEKWGLGVIILDSLGFFFNLKSSIKHKKI
jgi:hypothetical protein